MLIIYSLAEFAEGNLDFMLHVVFVMANNSSVPYFNWFAEESSKHPNIRFTFVCLYPEEPQMLEEMNGVGCDCHWIKFDARNRKQSFVKAVFPLFKLFRKIKPDVVHSHLFDDSLPSLFAARLAGVRVRVITKADTGFHYNHTPQWVKFDKFNNWNASHIIAISEECRDFVIDKENADPSKVKVIHHGIPVDKFTDQRDEYKKYLIEKYNLEGKRIVGTVSRLIEWKGYRYIIEAASHVVKQNPDVVFLFVGQGEQEEELRTLVAKNNLQDNIVFAGWVERKMIPSLYGILDVYLHAAINEPFGFVIAEAMMNGCSVVSTPTGAANDSIEARKNGLLVPYRNSKKIADAVTYVLENDVSVMKAKAKSTALSKFSFQNMWDKHMELYRDSKLHVNKS